METFLRRQDSYRWHWSQTCSNYPKETDILKSHTEPEYGLLCEECQKKEPVKRPSVEDK